MSQNFSNTRNIISFLLLAAILLLLAYLESNPYSSKRNTIAIGITQWPGFEYLFIAQKQGFFKQAGLNIELVELDSLAEVRRAFERGKVDGMAATLVEVLEAYKYFGQIAQPVLVIDYSKGADEILATGQFKTMRDLKGKKIGMEAGSFSAFLVNCALEMNDMKSADVNLIPMQTHKLSKALKMGEVDAITSYLPRSIRIKKELNTNVVFDSSLIAQRLVDVITINKEILKINPELHEQFIQAWRLTLDYTNKYPEDTLASLAERLTITNEEFKESMRSIHLVSADEQKQYFNKEGILMSTLTTIGRVVFIDTEDKEMDYSQFLHNRHIN